jgi:hypothetical protein
VSDVSDTVLSNKARILFTELLSETTGADATPELQKFLADLEAFISKEPFAVEMVRKKMENDRFNHRLTRKLLPQPEPQLLSPLVAAPTARVVVARVARVVPGEEVPW